MNMYNSFMNNIKASGKTVNVFLNYIWQRNRYLGGFDVLLASFYVGVIYLLAKLTLCTKCLLRPYTFNVNEYTSSTDPVGVRVVQSTPHTPPPHHFDSTVQSGYRIYSKIFARLTFYLVLLKFQQDYFTTLERVQKLLDDCQTG